MARPKKEIEEEVLENTISKTEFQVNSELFMELFNQQKEAMSSLKEELSLLKSKPAPLQVAEISIENLKAKDYGSSLEKLKSLNLPKKVQIKQYLDKSQENMGLTAAGISVLDGVGGKGGFKEAMGYLTKAGINYYLTGFDEGSINIKSIKDSEERAAAINEVKKVKELLEDIMQVDLSSTNTSFWKNIYFEVRGGVKTLNLNEPTELLMYYGIIGGGISQVASSLEFAERSNIGFKHYLHIDNVVENKKITSKRSINKAIAKLEELYDDSNSDKLYMIAKTVLPITKGFTKKDSIDRLYNDLNDFINGVNIPRGISEPHKLFMVASEKSLEDLTVKAVITDAKYYNFLKINEDGFFYNTTTFTLVGKSIAEIVEFYKNPLNNSEFSDLVIRVHEIWSK